MAIYSLHHQPIGKSTQARPHTAAAHVRYITRPSAVSRVDAARMPKAPGKAASFMVQGEEGDRKNARVADKLLLALPRELDAAQRAQLVRGFAEDVTQGRASWLAAFHDKGKDAQNPHAHLLIRDRDPATGKRVAGLSDNGSTERLRGLWEDHANQALERAGRPERIDRRTLEAQGIRREPTVHEGPKAQQMDRRGARPESRMRRYRNRPGSHLPYRDVDYRGVDGGRSRPDYNRQVRRQETPANYWAALDADNQQRELDQLRQIHLRHRPDLLDIPFIARPVKPLQRVNDAGVLSDRGLFQPQSNGQDSDMPKQHVPPCNRFPLQPPPQGRPTIFHHSLIYGTAPREGNEKMAPRDDDDSPDARWKANDAKKERLNGDFEHLLDNSYDDKEQAHKSMREHAADHGNDDLSHALRLEPGKFGAPPKDPAKAADAKGYRDKLAPVFNGYRDAEDEAGRLKYTHGDRPSGLDEPHGGNQPPSKLASFWDRSRPDSSPSGGADGVPQEGQQPRTGQGAPSQLQPSSYPLESPMRPQQDKGAEMGQGRQPEASRPYKLASPDEVEPWDLKSRPEQTPPARKPGSLENAVPTQPSQQAGHRPQSLEGAVPSQAPRQGGHRPQSLENAVPSQPQEQSRKPLEGSKALPTSPADGLARKPLETPIQAQPVKKPRKGLQDGM